MADTKERAIELIDQLQPAQLTAVVGLLEVMLQPLSEFLGTVPVEEEELSADTIASINRGEASLDRGEGIPHEQILREFGLGK
jgi:hypothetical protein